MIARFVIALALALDAFLWAEIVRARPAASYGLAQLDVGQGDAELFTAPAGVTVLTDGGPSGAVVRALEEALPASRREIDIVVITHPQRDHFAGVVDVLRRYRVGVVLWNGRSAAPGDEVWQALRAEADAHGVPMVAVGAGDRITGPGFTIDILSPDDSWRESAEPNDTGLVERIVSPAFTALLMADIGGTLEAELAARGGISADILKVGHHGSKYSSSPALIAAVRPRIALIGVGKGNRYGHPASSTAALLEKATGGNVFRTDRDGTVRVIAEPDGKISVSSLNPKP